MHSEALSINYQISYSLVHVWRGYNLVYVLFYLPVYFTKWKQIQNITLHKQNNFLQLQIYKHKLIFWKKLHAQFIIIIIISNHLIGS